MRKQAKVGAIEAISELRGKCTQTGEDISRTLAECQSQSALVLTWVKGPQAHYWKRKKQKRQQQLETAKSDLQRAMIAKPDADPRSFTDQHLAITRARRAVQEADEKLVATKYWTRELERQLMLFRGGLGPLSTAADVGLAQASQWLSQLADHLDGYLKTMPPMPNPAEPADLADGEHTTINQGRMGTAIPNQADADPADENQQ
jgi:hypothetical protein